MSHNEYAQQMAYDKQQKEEEDVNCLTDEEEEVQPSVADLVKEKHDAKKYEEFIKKTEIY